MTQTKTGVVGGVGSFGKWQWVCECGARATAAFDDREKARDGLKDHRKQCPLRKKKAETYPELQEEVAVAKSKKAEATAPAEKKEKKERKKRAPGVTPEQAKAALAKIQGGSSTLFAESKALGFTHNGPLRAALRTLLGLEKYNALMAGRRGRQKKEKPATKKAAPAKAKAKKAKPPAPPKPDAATPAGDPA